MQDPFRGLPDRPDHWMKIMQRAPAPHRMVIYFTPRSSSSRLTEILSRSRRLGEAAEIFNPEFVRNIARDLQVSDPSIYVELLLRSQHTRGIFSCEVTGLHLQACFPDERPFVRAFAGATAFWLIRRDIVAQAVSLAKMMRTGLGHTAQTSPEARAAGDAVFDYDAAEIRHWIRHIRSAEILTEDFFHRHRLTPLRLCYEDMVRLPPEKVLALITGYARLPAIPAEEAVAMMAETPLRHEKLGTSVNDEIAMQFRAAHVGLLARLERARAPMLARLHDPEQPLPAAGKLQADQVLAGFPPVLPRNPYGWRLRRMLQRLINSR